MKRISQYFSWVLVGFLIVLSLVPLRILLFFSPPLAFSIGKVLGYRKRVVTNNLMRSFPERSHQEILAIRKAFYLHFTDMFFETISFFSASRNAIRKRCKADPEGLALVDSYCREGRSVICLTGHLGNWEYQVPAYMDVRHFQVLPVYRPLKNKAFDWFIARIRNRFAAGIIPDRKVARTLMGLRKGGLPGAIGLVADQYPGGQEAMWLEFLSQDTPVYAGPEKLARMFDLPVTFMSTRKRKRGHYVVHVEPIASHPKDLPEGEITRIFFSMLEREIRKTPPFYLWSHRRWKKKRAKD